MPLSITIKEGPHIEGITLDNVIAQEIHPGSPEERIAAIKMQLTNRIKQGIRNYKIGDLAQQYYAAHVTESS